MQLSSEAANLQSIAQKLQGHKQLMRLKKLINFTCTNNWETNPHTLQELNLENLLEKLYQNNSSLEELSDSLYQSVDCLNRQGVYSELANLIIAKIGVLYEDSAGSTEVIMVKPSIRDSLPQTAIEQIILKLNNNKELPRIKKLIFYLAKDQWENDVNVIDSYDLKELILDLREIYANLGDLEKAFNDIVATLNRQHLYLAVSQTIVKEMGKLYKVEEQDTQLFAKTTTIVKNREDLEVDLPEKPSSSAPEQASEIKLNRKEVISENKKENKNTPKYTSFDWRLDIMQYTNPLRVKILLFSVIYHQFEKNEKDWSKLKSCTLEDLLNKILHRYQSLDEFETKLMVVAKNMPDSELNQQTATVISKSLMSFYQTD